MALRERSELDELLHSLRDAAAGILRRAADLLSPPPTSDPVERLLENAPVDDEPITDEDAAAIENARGEHERGETVSLAEIKRTSD